MLHQKHHLRARSLAYFSKAHSTKSLQLMLASRCFCLNNKMRFNLLESDVPSLTRFGERMLCCVMVILGYNTTAHSNNSALKPFATQQTPPLHLSRLANGLQVIILPDHRAPMVILQMWYAVGAADEPAQWYGVSHALEHLMFQGTTNVPNHELSQLSHYFGGQVNAVTSYSYTRYEQRYPKAQLAMALELEADRMQHLHIRSDAFEREQKVILAERQQRVTANPYGMAQEQLRAMIFPTSPLGRAVLGQNSEIETLTRSQLVSWYRQWYAPNNAVLVIAGDVETDQALKWVRRYFAGIASKKLTKYKDVSETAKLQARHLSLQLDVLNPTLYLSWNVSGLTNNQIFNKNHHAAQPQQNANASVGRTSTSTSTALCLELLQHILASRLDQGLSTQLIQQRNILSSVTVSYDPIQRHNQINKTKQPNVVGQSDRNSSQSTQAVAPVELQTLFERPLNSSFNISAIPQSGISLAQAEQAILQHIQQLQQTTLSTEQWQSYQQSLLASWTYTQDDLAQHATILGRLAVNGLDVNWLKQRQKQLLQLTPQQFQQVIQASLVPQFFSRLAVLPHDSASKQTTAHPTLASSLSLDHAASLSVSSPANRAKQPVAIDSLAKNALLSPNSNNSFVESQSNTAQASATVESEAP